MRPALALMLLLLLLLLLPAVAAWPESAAPALRPDVEAAWHEPAVVQPHTQWKGFLRLALDSNVSAAAYQVCRVGEPACFAPPHPATRLANGTFTFDTRDYKAAGTPIDYQPGWRLGVKWLLVEGNRTVPFPDSPELGDLEQHYLAFDVAAAPKSTPAVSLLPLLLALLAGVRRGR